MRIENHQACPCGLQALLSLRRDGASLRPRAVREPPAVSAYYAGPLATLLCGDCREVLAAMEADSVDAIVTDPPYGLSANPDTAEVLRAWLGDEAYETSGGGFMGKKWDSFVPGPRYW